MNRCTVCGQTVECRGWCNRVRDRLRASSPKPSGTPPNPPNPGAVAALFALIESGLSQAAIARRLGVSNKAVSQWKLGVYQPPAGPGALMIEWSDSILDR